MTQPISNPVNQAVDIEPIGHVAARGVAWVTLQSAVARVLSLVTNLALAWFLLEKDFGLYGLAATVLAFTGIFATSGINSFLFFRQKNYKHWANPVHWLSVSLGLGVSALTIGVAVVMISFFSIERPREFLLLISIMSLTPTINSFGSVANARMRIDLRFRELSLIESSVQIASTVAKISLAWAGLGAFSFAIPNVVMAVVRANLFWRFAVPPIRFSPEFHKWKFFSGKAGILVLSALISQLILYGDYAVLSNFVDRSALGLFFFAFNYSVVGIILLTNGLTVVLLQVISRENDRERQLQLFVRGARFATVIVFPVCLLQAALAEPLGMLFLPQKWHPAIPLLQILSLGMAGRTVSWLASTYLEARGKFRLRLYLSFASSIGFVFAAVLGCILGQTIGTSSSLAGSYRVVLGLAFAETIYFPLNSVLYSYFAIRDDTDKPLAMICRIAGNPLLAALTSTTVGYLIGRSLFPNWLLGGTIIVLTSLIVYAGLLKFFMPEQYDELRTHFSRLLKNIRKSLVRGPGTSTHAGIK